MKASRELNNAYKSLYRLLPIAEEFEKELSNLYSVPQQYQIYYILPILNRLVVGKVRTTDFPDAIMLVPEISEVLWVFQDLKTLRNKIIHTQRRFSYAEYMELLVLLGKGKGIYMKINRVLNLLEQRFGVDPTTLKLTQF